MKRDERYEANRELALPRPMRFVDERYLAWIRRQSCVLKGKPGHHCWGQIQACHIKTRGSGGGDDQVFPGCALAHSEQEGKTAKFEAKWAVNLKEESDWLRKKYETTTTKK
jgi:hypothetical protein